MSFDVERLYELLPAFYRIRDAVQGGQLQTPQDRAQIAQLQARLAAVSDPDGAEAAQLRTLLDERQRGPLKALLAVIAEQVAVLEEDLAQLYDDQFIETCAEWVVPYIGDLVGTRGLFAFPNAEFSQRAQVANTIAYRRRKGTAAVLEQLARDVTAWPASVVEYFQLLATTQYMNHLRPGNLATADLRQWEALERVNTPFDRMTRTVDVRRIESRRGKYNIPHVGIYLWRLGSYALTRSPAFKVDERRYRFDALGKDVPLYNRPETEDQITHLAEPINVPMPISRRVLDRYLDTYYGVDKSVLLTVDDKDITLAASIPFAASPPPEKLSDLISVCDLSDVQDAAGAVIGWAHLPEDTIAIDPVLGRIAFPEWQTPRSSVHVTYRYGFSAAIGGGEYGRAPTFDKALSQVIEVPSTGVMTLQEGLDQLRALLDGAVDLPGGVVEIKNNEYYVETPVISVPAGKKIELRAADECRPVLVLGGELQILGGENAEVTLNGLLVSGGPVHVPRQDDQNKLRKVRLQHCTLVPGLSLAIDVVVPGSSPAVLESPELSLAPKLVVDLPDTLVEIEQCIVGGLQVIDGAQVRIANSIVDATAETEVAYAGLGGDAAGGALQVKNSTIIGKVHTRIMELASNTIFFADLAAFDAWPTPVRATQLQQGCVRFSYLPPGSHVPRPYHCRPTSRDEAARMRPVFTSRRYGDPGYCQLSAHCAVEIRQGADDEAEMGVFHDLYQPQRVANLRARLDEYLRFSLEAGIFYAS